MYQSVLPAFLLILTYAVGSLLAVGLALLALRLKQVWWRIGVLIVLVAAGVGYVATAQHLYNACLQGSYANAAAPLDASKTLFFLEGGTPVRLVALEARTGTVRWQKPLDSSMDSRDTLTVADQMVFVTWGTDKLQQFGLRAYRASDGSQVWQTIAPAAFDGDSNSLQVADGLVEVWENQSGSPLQPGSTAPAHAAIAAFHERDGTVAWTIPLEGTLPAVNNNYVDQPLTAGDGMLFVSETIQGKPGTSAYHTREGSLVWQAPLGSTRPVYAAGILYLQDTQGLHALRASDGAVLWTQPLDLLGPSVSPMLSSAGQQVYVEADTSNGGLALYALQARDGAVLWSYPAGPPASGASPVLANGVVYYPSRADLLALDAQSGQLLRRYDINSNAGFGAPLVLGQEVLVQSHLDSPLDRYQCPGDHEPTDALFALHASDGAIYWRYQTSSAGWDVVGGV